MKRSPQIKYEDGIKYWLAENYWCYVEIYPPIFISGPFISLAKTGLLIVKRGFVWDGCSGPTWDCSENMRAGLIHDALYKLMRLNLLDRKWKEQADIEFYIALRQDVFSRLRSRLYYEGVDEFAGYATMEKARRKVYVAPERLSVPVSDRQEILKELGL